VQPEQSILVDIVETHVGGSRVSAGMTDNLREAVAEVVWSTEKATHSQKS
jgi:hypothetical protein